jgi:DNA-directed RNA polymerase subunit beta'
LRHRGWASPCAPSSTPAGRGLARQRILGRTAAEDVNDPGTGEVIVNAGTLIDEKTSTIEQGRRPVGEDPLGADLRDRTGVCGACYGRDLARGTPVNIGEAVGVIAAQSIGEPGTQLTMRTFHIGGAAQVASSRSMESNFEGTVVDQEPQRREELGRRLIAMGRNMAVAIVDADGKERATHRVPTARAAVDDGDKVKRGQRIAEWDPYTRPILTEVDGKVGFEDWSKASPSGNADEATGIAKRVVIDWRATRAARICAGDRHQGRQGRQGPSCPVAAKPATCCRSTPFSRSSRARRSSRATCSRVSRPESAKTRDITGGLPRVAELFEARRPKDHAIIAEIDGTIEFGRDYKNKRRIIIEPEDEKPSRSST